MSKVLEDQPETRPKTASPAQRLRSTMAAVRVSLSWLGVRKTLTREQKAQAADTFGAEIEFLSAGKKLLDTRHPAYKAVTSIRSRIVSYWKGITLPFPEPGVRLIRQEDVEAFDLQLATLKAELEEAVGQLNEEYAGLKSAARERLGRLFNAADYPASLLGLFDVQWDYPSVEPPSYLRQLSPELYRQECERVAARFDEAVRLAEEAFTSELADLVSHLRERISGQEDGKPKVFRDSAVENLRDFFERFQKLSIGSNQQLEQLVEQAEAIMRGVKPERLRDNQSFRNHVAAELSNVQTALDQLLVDRPRRNILRRPK
jgi:hypothetical protein